VARGGIEPPTYRLSGGSLHLSGVLRPEIPGLARLAHEQDSDNYRVAEVGPPRRATWLDTEGTTWRFEPVAPPAAEPLRASQRDLAACGQLPRAPRGSNQRRRLRSEPVL